MAFGRIAAITLLVMPLAASAQLIPGKITGEARFTNAASPSVATYLAAHPVLASSTSVRLVRQGQLVTVAFGPYEPAGGNDPLASYEIRADVDPAGSNFFIELS